MIKTNLPVILLRGLILLPNNEIRLEFDNDLSKNIIDVSELFHDNMLLVVSSLNPLEEIPEEKDLPKMGVVAKITNKIELPKIINDQIEKFASLFPLINVFIEL